MEREVLKILTDIVVKIEGGGVNLIMFLSRFFGHVSEAV
jgi:hypothetical protein